MDDGNSGLIEEFEEKFLIPFYWIGGIRNVRTLN
jgi:hypothetical protein